MRLLIPTDGSQCSENAVLVAGRLSQEADCDIILLHIVSDKGFKRKTWRKEGS